MTKARKLTGLSTLAVTARFGIADNCCSSDYRCLLDCDSLRMSLVSAHRPNCRLSQFVQELCFTSLVYDFCLNCKSIRLELLLLLLLLPLLLLLLLLPLLSVVAASAVVAAAAVVKDYCSNWYLYGSTGPRASSEPLFSTGTVPDNSFPV